MSRSLRVVFMPRWPDNPYQDLLAVALAPLGVEIRSLPRSTAFLAEALRGSRPDIVHLHAPDHYVVYSSHATVASARLALVAAQLLALRASGARLVWTAHDLINHEAHYPHLDRASRILTGALADAIVVHCEAARRAVLSRFRVRDGAKVFVIPHGHYVDAYTPTALSPAAAREALGLPRDGTVLLVLGNLRRHKGLGPLLDAFATLGRDDVRLVIAGRPFTPDIAADVETRIDGMTGVDFRPGFVPADAVALYMRAADAVVCPFLSSLTSGSVALAMSFGRACIAPRLGCIPEMLAEDGGILYDPDRPGALAEALAAAVERARALERMGQRNRAAIEARSWPAIARATLEIYRDCLTGRDQRRSDTEPRSS